MTFDEAEYRADAMTLASSGCRPEWQSEVDWREEGDGDWLCVTRIANDNQDGEVRAVFTFAARVAKDGTFLRTSGNYLPGSQYGALKKSKYWINLHPPHDYPGLLQDWTVVVSNLERIIERITEGGPINPLCPLIKAIGPKVKTVRVSALVFDELEDGDAPDDLIQKWRVPEKLQTALEDLYYTHRVVPLPVFDQDGKPIPANAVQDKVVGSLAEITLELKHTYHSKSGHSFFGVIRQVKVLQPVTKKSPSTSPLKNNRVAPYRSPRVVSSSSNGAYPHQMHFSRSLTYPAYQPCNLGSPAPASPAAVKVQSQAGQIIDNSDTSVTATESPLVANPPAFAGPPSATYNTPTPELIIGNSSNAAVVLDSQGNIQQYATGLNLDGSSPMMMGTAGEISTSHVLSPSGRQLTLTDTVHAPPGDFDTGSAFQQHPSTSLPSTAHPWKGSTSVVDMYAKAGGSDPNSTVLHKENVVQSTQNGSGNTPLSPPPEHFVPPAPSANVSSTAIVDAFARGRTPMPQGQAVSAQLSFPMSQGQTGLAHTSTPVPQGQANLPQATLFQAPGPISLGNVASPHASAVAHQGPAPFVQASSATLQPTHLPQARAVHPQTSTYEPERHIEVQPTPRIVNTAPAGVPMPGTNMTPSADQGSTSPALSECQMDIRQERDVLSPGAGTLGHVEAAVNDALQARVPDETSRFDESDTATASSSSSVQAIVGEREGEKLTEGMASPSAVDEQVDHTVDVPKVDVKGKTPVLRASDSRGAKRGETTSTAVLLMLTLTGYPSPSSVIRAPRTDAVARAEWDAGINAIQGVQDNARGRNEIRSPVNAARSKVTLSIDLQAVELQTHNGESVEPEHVADHLAGG
ncbi:hypothetical protein NP233_g9553 [Leucocoprinus birnbaumii]|uniref:Uncharacterized protein n=1 Tax=Leucocoprinus birnbaumii TaxID=56174 RepID=A0AAD5VKU8_9AGAR|nr:hypothetical protein NP233_g9553 [Leucocoprinus birnbaumii]